MKNIEIEFRAMITKEKYDWLNHFLKQNAEDLGEDNKDTIFYIFPDKLFKVVNEISKNKAKIVLKNNRLGKGNHFQEWEIKINPSDYEKTIDMFNHMEFPCKSMRAWQERHNYI